MAPAPDPLYEAGHAARLRRLHGLPAPPPIRHSAMLMGRLVRRIGARSFPCRRGVLGPWIRPPLAAVAAALVLSGTDIKRDTSRRGEISLAWFPVVYSALLVLS